MKIKLVILTLLFIGISCVEVMMWDVEIIWLFSQKCKHGICVKTIFVKMKQHESLLFFVFFYIDQILFYIQILTCMY